MGTIDTTILSVDESNDSFGDMLRAANPNRSVVSAPDELPAMLCRGRVRIERRLGVGGMGTVYAATDGGRPIALKSLNHFSPADIYRLKNEFRQLAKLSHPNLVMVHELFHDPPFWFFTMEKVSGQSLDRYWSALPNGDGTALRHLVRQIIEGVCAIHDAGLVHRDLKPSNIMVESSGRVIVLDFGLVGGQHVGSEGVTVAGQVCGTPAYMAPEQFCGEPASAASDWYAVGVVLWELVVGNCPYGGSLSDIVRQKRQGPAPSIAGATLADAELTVLCNALLRPNPCDRPSSLELAELVQRWNLVAQAPSVHSQRATARPFVGRQHVLSVLTESYQRALAGRPTLVWISGPSGIGKSRLLDHFSDLLAAEDAPVVLKGRCVEREFVPHKAFDGVVDHFSRIARQLPANETAQLVPKHPRSVGQLFPVLLRVGAIDKAAREQRVDGPDLDALVRRRRGLTGFKDLLHRLAERRHLVLFLEDMQWTDEDSLLLLRELMSPPDPPAMLVIGTSREALHRDAGLDFCATSIALEPLTLDESAELVAGILPEELLKRDTLAIGLAHQAAGHPLYLVELARAFPSIDGQSKTWSLAELFEHRISRLDREARTVLELVVLAGRPLPLTAALELCGAGVERTMRTLRHELLVRHSPHHAPAGFELEHHQVGEVTRALLPGPERVALHSRLAQWLLMSHDSDPEWLVSQLVLAGQHEHATSHAARAARSAAARLAFSSAASMFALALESAPSDNTLRIEYAEALSAAKRCDEAAQQYQIAAQQEGPDGQGIKFRALAATQWIRAGYLHQGIAELRAVLAQVGVAWPESKVTLIARYLWQRSRVAKLNLKVVPSEVETPPREVVAKLDALAPASTVFGAFDYIRGGYFSTLALPLAFQTGHTRFLLNAVAAEAVYRGMSAGIGAETTISELTALMQSLNLPACEIDYRRAILDLVRAMGDYWAGRWATVDGHARAAEYTFDNLVHGSSWEATLLRSIRHTAQLQRAPGELASAIPSLLRDAEERSDLYAIADLKLAQVGIDLASYGPNPALEKLRALKQQLDSSQLSAMHHLVVCANVQILLEQGNAHDAEGYLAVEWRICRKRGLNAFPLVRAAFCGMTADVLCASTHITTGARVRKLRRLADRVEREPLGLAPGIAASVRASAAELEGETDRAVNYSKQARIHLEAAGLGLAALAECVDCDATGESARLMQQRGVRDPSSWRRRRRCFL